MKEHGQAFHCAPSFPLFLSSPRAFHPPLPFLHSVCPTPSYFVSLCLLCSPTLFLSHILFVTSPFYLSYISTFLHPSLSFYYLFLPILHLLFPLSVFSPLLLIFRSSVPSLPPIFLSFFGPLIPYLDYFFTYVSFLFPSSVSFSSFSCNSSFFVIALYIIFTSRNVKAVEFKVSFSRSTFHFKRF